ncbi:MAG: hypothetical protein K0R39_1168 [Symbiobacteriaceae bacterium]|jgi:hypothetical protein|nr:hypothetical protein [Symbiobacteriaceae bacterium]
MLTVLLQSAVLLILGQLLLGAVGYVVPQGLAWLGLPLWIFLFWLILRVARVLRAEMEKKGLQRHPVVPWQMAAWAVLLWQWPSVILLPKGTFVPGVLGQIWNGVMLPVQGTVGLVSEAAGTALGPWLWMAVVLEALIFGLIVGRPLATVLPGVRQAAELPQRQVAAAGGWAPARTLKDVRGKRHHTPPKKR